MNVISAPLKRGLRSGLGLLGLELRRRPGPQALSDIVRRIIAQAPAAEPESRAWRVEFFGPSGVGKTHFATELARRRTPAAAG